MTPRTAQPRRRTQEERREQTRRKLLDAAVIVLHDIGYARFTFALVAKQAKMTTGAIQHQFANKNEFLEAVVFERLLHVGDGFFEPLPDQSGKSVRDRCKVMVERAWTVYGAPSYPVAWNIILGSQRDSDLQESLISAQRQMLEKIGLPEIRRAFAGLGLSRGKLRDLQMFLHAQLRGLALLGPMRYQESFYRKQLRMLVNVLETYVESMLDSSSE